MEKNYIFIDFDGVILDSESRMLERKYNLGFCNHNDKIEFEKYFEYTNLHPEEWDYILKEARPINDSIEVLKTLENLKKNVAILTKIHTLYEMKLKVEILRKKYKILYPVIFVPPNTKKSDVIVPNGQLLIDDFYGNIQDWINKGGKGMIFDPTIKSNTNKKIKSLSFLIKE